MAETIGMNFSSSYSITLPGSAPQAGQALISDGNGNLTWFSGGDIGGVIAGTGLTGGGLTGDVTLNVDVGTTSGKIIQLDGCFLFYL